MAIPAFLLPLCLFLHASIFCIALTKHQVLPTTTSRPAAIVYTIAGSDSGGGAGIQADLKAIHSLSGGTCHGCSAITCLTAQNSCGVSNVHFPPVEFLVEQLSALESDFYPKAVKVGMLGTRDLALEVGKWLRQLKENVDQEGTAPFVVVDPVMISTSGHKLIDENAIHALIHNVFPFADLVTPNKFEAEELIGKKLTTLREIEEGAREILKMGPKAVMIKGGHLLDEDQMDSVGQKSTKESSTATSLEHHDTTVSISYAQDYLVTNQAVSLSGKPVTDQPRICDGARGIWLRSVRYDTVHTHGTGCTLSSAIATAWAMGQREREMFSNSKNDENIGALSSMYLVDACCIAKAYVNAGIAQGMQIGKGPGPVSHTAYPNSSRSFPVIALASTSFYTPRFLPMRSYRASASLPTDKSTVIFGRILPIVDSIESLKKALIASEIDDIQLRFKDNSDYHTIVDRIRQAQKICQSRGVRLWINDHWKAALEADGCFGIHLGQEDLATCIKMGGLELIRSSGLGLGISTHSYSELAVALGVRPSYISLGPVFRTSSKDVKFNPQGLATVQQWRNLIPDDIPLVAIGGIVNAELAKAVREAGADCVAVIKAVTKVDDVSRAVKDLCEAMS